MSFFIYHLFFKCIAPDMPYSCLFTVVNSTDEYAYYDYTEEPSTTSDYDLSWLVELFDEPGKVLVIRRPGLVVCVWFIEFKVLYILITTRC